MALRRRGEREHPAVGPRDHRQSPRPADEVPMATPPPGLVELGDVCAVGVRAALPRRHDEAICRRGMTRAGERSPLVILSLGCEHGKGGTLAKLSTILDQIDAGTMQLPEFQRGYVW